jgi:hypothetical protein
MVVTIVTRCGNRRLSRRRCRIQTFFARGSLICCAHSATNGLGYLSIWAVNKIAWAISRMDLRVFIDSC